MKRKKNGSLPAVALITACAALLGCRSSAPASYTQITQEEAAEIMRNETGYILLDVRTQDEYESGYIPGAICIPNESITGDELPQLPDKTKKILVYCRSGNRSKQAAQKLADMGYTNVLEFGGISTWKGDIVFPYDPVLILDSHAPADNNGVLFEVTEYSDKVLTAKITNNSGEVFSYGEPFVLYAMKDGEWEEMKWDEEIVWIMIAYELPDGESAEVRCDLSGISGIDSGEYMLEKSSLKTQFWLVYTE